MKSLWVHKLYQTCFVQVWLWQSWMNWRQDFSLGQNYYMCLKWSRPEIPMKTRNDRVWPALGSKYGGWRVAWRHTGKRVPKKRSFFVFCAESRFDCSNSSCWKNINYFYPLSNVLWEQWPTTSSLFDPIPFWTKRITEKARQRNPSSKRSLSVSVHCNVFSVHRAWKRRDKIDFKGEGSCQRAQNIQLLFCLWKQKCAPLVKLAADGRNWSPKKTASEIRRQTGFVHKKQKSDQKTKKKEIMSSMFFQKIWKAVCKRIIHASSPRTKRHSLTFWWIGCV